jgi:hypothetical protein
MISSPIVTKQKSLTLVKPFSLNGVGHLSKIF